MRRTFQGRRKELLLTREKVSCKVGRNVRANYFQTLHHHPRRNGEPRGSRSRNPRIEMGTVSLFHDYEKLRIVSSIKKNLIYSICLRFLYYSTMIIIYGLNYNCFASKDGSGTFSRDTWTLRLLHESDIVC